jgi:hypothetical protein
MQDVIELADIAANARRGTTAAISPVALLSGASTCCSTSNAVPALLAAFFPGLEDADRDAGFDVPAAQGRIRWVSACERWY